MINNKKVLVTGASSGIGLALSEFLLNSNCNLVAVGRDEAKITYLKDKFPKTFKFLSIDLNEFSTYNKIFNDTLAIQKFDGFVHCAGIEETLPLPLYNPDNIAKIFSINVFSGIELLRFFSKKKYSNDGASVIYISSVMGELGQPGKIGYCATKAAILGIVKSAALELAKRKISKD